MQKLFLFAVLLIFTACSVKNVETTITTDFTQAIYEKIEIQKPFIKRPAKIIAQTKKTLNLDLFLMDKTIEIPESTSNKIDISKTISEIN